MPPSPPAGTRYQTRPLLRRLVPCDKPALIRLHTESFPVRYPDTFYENCTAVGSSLYTLGAEAPGLSPRGSQSTSYRCSGGSDVTGSIRASFKERRKVAAESLGTSGGGGGGGGGGDREGGTYVTGSTYVGGGGGGRPREVVGALVARLCPFGECDREDANLLTTTATTTTTTTAAAAAAATTRATTRAEASVWVAYIMTLAVDPAYRRSGLGSELVKCLVRDMRAARQGRIRAIFLHTLATNTGAMRFYEQLAFRCHAILPRYYVYDGNVADAATYVLYVNGGAPPVGHAQREEGTDNVIKGREEVRQPLGSQSSQRQFAWSPPSLAKYAATAVDMTATTTAEKVVRPVEGYTSAGDSFLSTMAGLSLGTIARVLGSCFDAA